METEEAVRTRLNRREFSPEPVDDDDLERILEAGRRAPSARNWQPWDFVVVTDADRKAQLAGVWPGAWHVAHAATVIALVAPVVEREQEKTLYFDLGQTTITIMLVATDLGLATAHANASDQDLARSILGFPEDRFLSNMISVGHPAAGALGQIEVDRRPLDELVHRETW